MDSKRYLMESARTVSPRFDADKVSGTMAQYAINDALAIGATLDAIRASLFYGKTNQFTLQNTAYPNFSDIFPGVSRDLVHAALGKVSESLELLEAVLRPAEQVDRTNVREEMGDDEWFSAMVYRWLNELPEDARERNIAKLRARYPEKFTVLEYSNRDLDAERKVLGE